MDSRTTAGFLLTNVHDVSLLVDHDVPVVPVLDLEEEPDDAVGRHGGDEVATGPLERLRALLPELLLEVEEQVGVGLPPDLVSGLGVRHALNHAALERRTKETRADIELINGGVKFRNFFFKCLKIIPSF